MLWRILFAVVTLFTWYALYRTLREVRRVQAATAMDPILIEGKGQVSSTTPAVTFVPTRLRLQFGSAGTLPVEIDQQNVWRWYTLATIMWGLKTDTQGMGEAGRHWSIFLIFDIPTTFRQICVNGSGAVLPLYEVKDASERGALIVFSGNLDGVVIDIQLL